MVHVVQCRPGLLGCVAILLAGLIGCGNGGGNGGGGGAATVENRVKQRLTEILALIKADKKSELAKYIVYRGEDEARNWKTVSDYAVAEEAANVDRICKRMARYIALGEPKFVEFRSEKESEGTWLVWKVQFGEGAQAKSVYLACLEIQGEVALGDIDTSGD